MDNENLKNAIDQLDLNLVNDILNKCGNVNRLVINYKNSRITPLLYAINILLDDTTKRHKMDEIILRLISAGVDVNAKGSWTVTPLILAAWLRRSEEIVCQLINAGSNVNEVYAPTSDSALMIAVRFHYSKRVIDSLIRANANVNYSNRGQETALDYAFIRKSKPEIFMSLIKAGANVHARDYYDRNYFFQVSCSNCDGSNCEYQEIINVFLNRGVDIKETDKYGNNIFHLSNCQYLMRVAVNSGVPLDSVNNQGIAPLMHAVLFSNVKRVNKLLLMNADPNGINGNFKNVKEYFCYANRIDNILNLLIYHGADLYSNNHRTSLHEFLMSGIFFNVDVLKIIVKHLLLFFNENALNDFFCYEYYNYQGRINTLAYKCKRELNKMRRSFLKGSLTLYKFCNLKRYYKSKYFDIPYGGYEYNCKQIKELFPIYEDLIIMRIKDYKVERFKKVARKSLEGIIVRSVSSEPETNSGELLNYDCLTFIASYLDNKQVYNLFLAAVCD